MLITLAPDTGKEGSAGCLGPGRSQQGRGTGQPALLCSAEVPRLTGLRQPEEGPLLPESSLGTDVGAPGLVCTPNPDLRAAVSSLVPAKDGAQHVLTS